MIVREYDDGRDREQVIGLWKQVLGYASAHNEPSLAIARKVEVADRLFFVAADGDRVAGTVMAGYDGHRGWIYAVAVAPDRRREGIGTALMRHAEAALRERRCVKVNLQITADNVAVTGFYERLGFAVEPRISMGKKL